MDTHEPIPEAPRALPGGWALIKSAFAQYKMHFEALLPMLLIVFVASLLNTIVATGKDAFAISLASLLNVFIVFISYIAIVFVITSEHPRKGETSLYYQKAWNMAWAYLFVAVLVACASFGRLQGQMLAGGGFFLFIIPGFIASMYLGFSTFIFITEDVRGIQALVRSWYYVRGNFWKIFIRYLALLILLIIVTGLYSGIMGIFGHNLFTAHKTFAATVLMDILNTFFTSPFTIFFLFVLYRELKSRKTLLPSEAEEKEIKKGLKILIIIGIVGAALLVCLGLFFLGTMYSGLLQRPM